MGKKPARDTLKPARACLPHFLSSTLFTGALAHLIAGTPTGTRKVAEKMTIPLTAKDAAGNRISCPGRPAELHNFDLAGNVDEVAFGCGGSDYQVTFIPTLPGAQQVTLGHYTAPGGSLDIDDGTVSLGTVAIGSCSVSHTSVAWPSGPLVAGTSYTALVTLRDAKVRPKRA